MFELISSKTVNIRKPHVCFGCGREFSPPCSMYKNFAKDGEVSSYYLCPTCDDITRDFEYDDTFGFSDLRDEALRRENEDEKA